MKSLSLEFFRYFFMLIIAIWHCSTINIFEHGYLPVEFFFILSGYLLYRSNVKRKQSTFDYTLNKIKKFYPEYLIAFLILLVFNYSHIDSWTYMLDRIPELLFIQSIGIFSGSSLNPPSWYLSVLIYGGAILYAAMNVNRNVMLKVFCPVFCLLFYTYIFSTGDSMEHWGKIGCFSLPFWRGVADMSLGMMLGYWHYHNLDVVSKHLKTLNSLSIFSLVLFLVILFTIQHYDKYALLLVPLIIIASMESKTLFNRMISGRFVSKLGGVSYTMLVIHIPYNKVFMKIPFFEDGGLMVIIVYIIGLTFTSFLFKYFSDKFITIMNSK